METSNNHAAEELLEKLRTALKTNGDFPASAHVVNELKALTSNPQTTASQVTEVILREPSLGTRVLHLVNSSFYRRAKPIMTVSQAVIQIGMRPLAELCSGLILLQKFVPDARRGGPFAACLQRTIVTSLLSSQLGQSSSGNKIANTQEEQGYLIGSFSEMGILLLAYYFPKVYDSAARRSEQKNQPIEQCIFELTGLTPLQLSVEVLKSLNMPDYYQQVLTAAIQINSKSPIISGPNSPSEASIKVAKYVCAAQDLSRVIVSNGDAAQLAEVLQTISKDYQISTEAVTKSLQALPTLFKDHCDAIEIKLPHLPTSIVNFGSAQVTDAIVVTDTSASIERFLEDVRKAVDNREPPASVVTLVMETLAWSMKFDRVLLLLIDKQHTKMSGRIALGDKIDFDPRTIERTIATLGHYAPDVQAYKFSRPVFMGDPILPNGHPLIALPIGRGDKCVGVIYADFVQANKDLIDINEQNTITALADYLHKSVVAHSKK